MHKHKINSITVNINKINGENTELIFTNNLKKTNLDEIYINYEQQTGVNKNKINLYFLNSQINTINQALINLQCIIGSENIENIEDIDNRPQIYNPNINQNAQQTRDIFPSFYIKIYQLLKIKNDFDNNQENIDLDNYPNRLPRYNEKIINHYRELILTRVAINMLNENSCILKLYVNKTRRRL